jgi:hypothetical protein
MCIIYLTYPYTPYYQEHKQGTFRQHSGNIQGTFREHSGNIQVKLKRTPVGLHPNRKTHLKRE